MFCFSRRSKLRFLYTDSGRHMLRMLVPSQGIVDTIILYNRQRLPFYRPCL